jgi:integrase
MKIKFTKEFVKNIKPDTSKILSYLDDIQRSLELRVYPSGKKTYCVYRFNKLLARAERIVIGDATEISISYARQQTQTIISQRAEIRASEKTLENIFSIYININSQLSNGHIYRMTSIFNEHFKSMHKTKIQNIDLLTTKHFLNTKLKDYSPAYVNKMRAIIVKLMRFAEKELKIKIDNDFTSIKKFRELPKNYCLNIDETRKLLNYCNDHKYIDLSKIVLLALYTGLRKESILSLRHEYFADNWLIVPAINVKNREMQKIFIVKELRYIFENAKGFVFPALSDSGHINTIEKRKTKLFKSLEINARFHDLKHTFVTSCYRSAIDPHLISIMAGHKLKGMTYHYAHASESDLMQGYEKLSKYYKNILQKIKKSTC